MAVFDSQNHTWQEVPSENNGKSAQSKPPTQPPLRCPECGSSRIWKDGLTYARSETDGDIAIQRYICCDCGPRFSEDTALGSRMGSNPTGRRDICRSESYLQPNSHVFNRCSGLSTCQVSVTETEGTKNLSQQRTRIEKRPAGGTKQAEIRGKIIEYLWHLKKEGYAESTVKMRTRVLKQLTKEGANLLDPELVKRVIATHDNWSEGYKLSIVNAYDKFLEMLGLHWDPPSYQRVRELPFIPLEKEIDALIAGCGRKVAASLQTMKETAMRIGEVWQLRWTSINEEKQTIRCRSEKHGNPRMFKVSAKLIAMLNALPKTSEKAFGGTSLNGHRWNFTKQKRRLARKLQNPRLEQITFHTFRHWKATMEYHRTKDILHVKQLLGHRKIDSTLVYTQLVDFESDDEFISRVATSLKGARAMIEAGFEYVTDMDDVKLFRKRK